MLRRLFVVGAALASIGAAIGITRARASFRSWGVDPSEAEKALPGDELVPDAMAIDTRGIDIAAPPDKVWPWLVQMGHGRAGWYSYEQMDMSKPSADKILPEFQNLAVGDLVPTHPGGGFEVKTLDPGKALVLYTDRALMTALRSQTAEATSADATSTEAMSADATSQDQTAAAIEAATSAFGDPSMQGEFLGSWAFVLEPSASGGTRLIERFRGHVTPAEGQAGKQASMPPFTGNVLQFGLFVMVRRQLLGIRDRVEGRPIKHARAGRISLPTRMRGASPA